jgi:hypothetical protein
MYSLNLSGFQKMNSGGEADRLDGTVVALHRHAASGQLADRRDAESSAVSDLLWIGLVDQSEGERDERAEVC